MLRDTYAEIDTKAFKYNINVLRKAAGTPLMAVIKADAYGHGAAVMSKEAYAAGIRWFAVSNPDEALEIHDLLPDARILVLSSVLEKAHEDMIRNGVSVTVYKPEHIYMLEQAASGLCMQARVHVKADTGMGRIGFCGDGELARLLDAFEKCPHVNFEGFFTHFAAADEEDLSYSEKQLSRFIHFRELVASRGWKPLYHAANSAGIIALPKARFDLCRAGISMYGYPPSDEISMNGITLKPVMRLMSYVSHVKEIEDGESVSYGRRYIAQGKRKIATVPAGYADGYMRALSGKAEAVIDNKRVKQIGRVCMDQIMFDVTGHDIEEGAPVELFGPDLGADELAAAAGTISYELLTGITKRVPRLYI